MVPNEPLHECRGRFIVVLICGPSLFCVGWLLRDDRPDEMLTKLEQAETLHIEAAKAHEVLLDRYQAQKLTNEGLAWGLIHQTLPRWNRCVALLDEVAALGGRGEVVDDLTAYYRMRQEATSQIIGALESNDLPLFTTASGRWREADRIAAKIGQQRKDAAEAPQSPANTRSALEDPGGTPFPPGLLVRLQHSS